MLDCKDHILSHISSILRLYCDNLAIKTPISISFDYRKMKNVEGLITHLARNPGFGADFFFFFLEELKITLVKCQITTLAKFGMDAL